MSEEQHEQSILQVHAALILLLRNNNKRLRISVEDAFVGVGEDSQVVVQDESLDEFLDKALSEKKE